MNRIFISTNYNQLKPIIKSFNNSIVYLIVNIKEDEYVSIENGNIVLIKDKNKNEAGTNVKIEFLPSQFMINKDSDYLLFHTETSDKIKNLFNHTQQGRHDNSEDAKYKPVFDIILGNNNNKVKAIIEYLFNPQKAEALERQKTDFLYSIYNGKKPNEIEILDSVKQANDTDNLSATFNEKTYNRQLDHQDTTILEAEEQGRKLTLLRDALLANK